ncbi:MAG: hypothetical protein ACOC22_03145, partial [bacterium]
MNKKIRILFYNVDSAGVNYFRTLTPATQLERDHSDKFYIEINSSLDFKEENTLDYLKSFDIIHYHRQLVSDVNKMKILSKELKKAGVTLIMDIDDYWHLHNKHPYYGTAVQKKVHVPIIENLKIADYVTTTTDLFLSEIRKITGKNNVYVFYNSINPEWMKQFQNNWKPDPDGRVRITYMAGSSHWIDVQQLIGVTNVLSNDPTLKDKFKIIIAGWDTEGKTTEISFNEEFAKELQNIGMWTHDVVKIINKTRGDVDAIPNLSQELKDKYRNNIFIENKRDIHSTESVYFEYEKIFGGIEMWMSEKRYRAGGTLSLIKGSDFQSGEIKSGSFYTSSSGDSLYINTRSVLKMNQSTNQRLKNFSGYGAAVDIHFSFHPDNPRDGYFLEIMDIGMIHWNNVESITIDGENSFTGKEIDNLFSTTDTLISDFKIDSLENILETDIHDSKVNYMWPGV